jgi:gluconate 5-dehydrogenase
MELNEAFSLKGQTALITGGGTGIGFGIAAAFAAAGAEVVITGRREAVLQEAIGRLGPRASFYVQDVTHLEACPDFVSRVWKERGPIGILVNNAGHSVKKPAVEMTNGDFDEMLDVHVRGAFALSREVGRLMLERETGSLIFIASMTSLFAVPYVVGYAAAKSAYLGMVRTLAAEWSARGVRVNAIAPGWIRTPLLERTVDADPERRAAVLKRTPMGQYGTVEDIAWAAVYLSSLAGKFVTGTTLVVDGGASIGF